MTTPGVAKQKTVAVKWRDTLFNWQTRIDYSDTSRYIAGGKLTTLSRENIDSIASSMDRAVIEGKSWPLVLGIYSYLLDKGNFNPKHTGGTLIAKRTIDEMFADKTLTGCHDFGIALTAALRSFGIPAIIIDTAAVPWAIAYARGGQSAMFEGHVFVEAFIDSEWFVLNSIRPEVMVDYDPMNPMLNFPLNKNKQYYVMFKGLDPFDYGIRSNKDITDAMIASAKKIAGDSNIVSPGKVVPVKMMASRGAGK